MGGVKKDVIFIPIVIVLMFVIVFYRRYNPFALLVDTFTAVLVIATYNRYKKKIKIHTAMRFIGMHSLNVFLFHTFIYYLYFPNLIYWSTNPILIFGTLLVVSIFISMGINKLKDFVNCFCFLTLENNRTQKLKTKV